MSACKEAILKLRKTMCLPASMEAMLDAAVAAEQHQGEPVALGIPDECPHLIVFDDAAVGQILFAGSGARSAALKKWESISVSWNAHLFVRVARNSRDDGHPCATVAGPAEVERLRDQLAAWQALAAERLEVTTGLRTQLAEAEALSARLNAEAERHARSLAEAHALLREVLKLYIGLDLAGRIGAALSASADPSAPAERMAAIRSEAAELSSKLKHACCQSCMANPCDCAIQGAPVELDELAAFEAAYDRGELLCMDGPYDNPRKNQAFATWQARAALERKP